METKAAQDELPDRSAGRDPLALYLRDLEGALLNPEVRRHPPQVAALLAEDMVEFGASGRQWTRAELLHALATEAIPAMRMEDFECHELADGVALVTYRLVGSDAGTGAQSDSLRSSVWTRISGVWRLRFHQGTRQP